MTLYKIITDEQNARRLATWFKDAVLSEDGKALYAHLTPEQAHSLKRDHGIDAHPMPKPKM